MSGKNLLKEEDLEKVCGGVISDSAYTYQIDDYVEYTFRNILFCVHIRELCPQPEAYVVNQASKTGNNDPTYDNTLYFNGGPKSVQKTVYKVCPSWCPDLR